MHMEELEKKARAYDEVREKIAQRFGSNVAEEIFSEYEMNEDEKIRKELIKFVKVNIPDEERYIAWLEKQGEQNLPSVNERAWLYLVSDVLTWKDGIGQYLDDPRVQKLAKELCSEYAQKLYNYPISSNSLNIGNNNQEPADKVETKFHEGDVMRTLQEAADGVNGGLPVIVSIDENYYHCTNELIPIKDQDNYEYPPMNRKNTCNEENENIRKAILKYFTKCWGNCKDDVCGIHVEDAIAWLEKQEEQVEINPSEFDLRLNRLLNQFETLPKEELASSLRFYLNVVQNGGTYKEEEHDSIKEPNFFDDFRKTDSEAEPKFHEGEWITNGDYTWKIVEVKPLDYILQSQDGNIVDDTISHVDEQFHSFTIQDAKDGDVLYSLDSKQPFIFKHRKPNEQAEAYCGINIYGKFFVGNTKDCVITTDKYIPADKFQRDLLFYKMKENGYEWEAEKKELKKIEHSAWSEEDEKNLQGIIDEIQANKSDAPSYDINVYDRYLNWLKSIKDKVQPQQDWSKEDEKMLNKLIGVLDGTNKEDYHEGWEDIFLPWLKAIKQRVGWKPSEEQMKALALALCDVHGMSYKKHLFSLNQQLKQL